VKNNASDLFFAHLPTVEEKDAAIFAPVSSDKVTKLY